MIYGLLNTPTIEDTRQELKEKILESFNFKKGTPLSKARDLYKKSDFDITPKWKIDLALANELLNKGRI